MPIPQTTINPILSSIITNSKEAIEHHPRQVSKTNRAIYQSSISSSINSIPASQTQAPITDHLCHWFVKPTEWPPPQLAEAHDWTIKEAGCHCSVSKTQWRDHKWNEVEQTEGESSSSISVWNKKTIRQIKGRQKPKKEKKRKGWGDLQFYSSNTASAKFCCHWLTLWSFRRSLQPGNFWPN